MSKYIELNKPQMDWVQKTFSAMAVYTKKLNEVKQPFSDEQWEEIIKRFHTYAEKSRNNKLIIDGCVALISYLDRKDRHVMIEHGMEMKPFWEKGEYLSTEQFGVVEKCIDDWFDCMKESNISSIGKDVYVNAEEKLDEYYELSNQDVLIGGIRKTFVDYMDYCKRKRLNNESQEIENNKHYKVKNR